VEFVRRGFARGDIDVIVSQLRRSQLRKRVVELRPLFFHALGDTRRNEFVISCARARMCVEGGGGGGVYVYLASITSRSFLNIYTLISISYMAM